MSLSQPASHEHLAIEAELRAGSCRFVRERLRLPMGIEGSFGWLRHPDTVLVVPRGGDGRFLLVRRYRPAVGRWVLEFPSGPLDPGETPAAGAARLLRELTGQTGLGWRRLGALRPNPGYSDEHMTLGLMTLAAPGAEADAEPETPPDLELWRCTAAALEAALMGVEECVDGRSVSAWLLAGPLASR